MAKRINWTAEEDSFLIENYPLYGLKESVEKMNRILNTDKSIRVAKNRMKKLKELYGIDYPSRKNPNWSKEEDDFLIENYTKFNMTKLSELLYSKFGVKRTKEAIVVHMIVLRERGEADENNRRIKAEFTKEEDAYIIANYSNLGPKKVSEDLNNIFGLNRTPNGVEMRVRLLRKKYYIPKRITPGRNKLGECKKWTEEEDNYILNNYNNGGSKEIQKGLFEEFGSERTIQAITSRAKNLRKKGLSCTGYNKYSEEENRIIKEIYPDNGSEETIKQIYIRLGIKRPVSSLRSHATKNLKLELTEKGITKIHSKELGTISWRKGGKDIPEQYYIKVELGNEKYEWVPLHRYLFGEDAKDRTVIFLNRDYSDIRKDNLACISKSVASSLISNNFYSEDPEVTKAGIAWCELANALKEQGIDVKELIKDLEREVNE